jgi:hypothetical protein
MANSFDNDINVEPLATVVWQDRTTSPPTGLLQVGYTAVDPNGLRTAPIGSLLSGPAGTWQNTDGLTTWVALGGGGSSSPDGVYLTYNVFAPANTGAIFNDWAALQIVAAALVAAGGSFRIWILSDLTFPAGSSLIGDGIYAGFTEPRYQIAVPDSVTWTTTTSDLVLSGSMRFEFASTATRVLSTANHRIRASERVQLIATIGATLPPFLFTGGGSGGEGSGSVHQIELSSGAQILEGAVPAFAADVDDTGIEVFLSGSEAFIENNTFETAGSGVLQFFWRDPSVESGTATSSDQSATWIGGGSSVKYMQRLFDFAGQVDADGGTVRSSTVDTERIIATCTVPAAWLDESNLTARLRCALQCTAVDGGGGGPPSTGQVTVRVRLDGIAGTILFDYPATSMILDGVCVIDMTVRTVTPGAVGDVDVFGFATNVPFDGGGTAGSFTRTALAALLLGANNIVVTVQFDVQVTNTIRCNGATLDIGGQRVP